MHVVIGVRRDHHGRRHVAEIGVVTTSRDAAGLDLRVEPAWIHGAGGAERLPGRQALNSLLRHRLPAVAESEER